MKAGTLGTRRQLFMLGILGAVLILALVKWGGRSSAPAVGPASAAATVAQSPEDDRPAARRPRKAEKKEITWKDVEIVTVQDLEPPKSRRAPEAGRNIFDFRAPTVAPLPTPTPAPPPPPAPGSPGFVGPVPPPPPTPTPLPPEIPFKFIGTFGPRDRSIAVLVLGDQIVNARAGDIVFERFLLKRVGYESIDVGFVGPWTETKRLGITP